ncbi:MAG: hypothetical protein H0T89_03505 [Deltaproteobacteria bacterium]|nr:hypothetical protein [Deltaproteobacteria bacterium]MDQ3299114.1 hypothetical protein [Myxococcota bacterium]
MTSSGRVVVLAVLAALAACDDKGIDPITRITAPRVLAITTEPSALPVDGELALTAMTVDPDGPRIGIGASSPVDGRPVDAMRMRACAPWKFITEPARDCVGDDALPLEIDATGRAVMSAAALATAFPSPAGVPAAPDPWRAALAAGLKLRVPIIAEVEVDGQTLVARRDVDVVEATVQRQNPRFGEIRFDGISTRTLRAGQRYVLTATVDRTSLDEAPAAEPSGALERVVCNLYSPTGELTEPEVAVEPEALVPESTPGTYTAGPRATTWLFVVATDETGGMSATSVPITIE